MEKTIKRQTLPRTDSIEELARFWDTHDLTDFEGHLAEVAESVFVRAQGKSLSIDLQPAEAQRLKKIARSTGVKETSIVRQWILEKLHASSRAGRKPDKRMQPARRSPARD